MNDPVVKSRRQKPAQCAKSQEDVPSRQWADRLPPNFLRINRVLFPVTTLGHGQRVGVWTQGCHLHCPECISRDTWDPDGGTGVEPGQLLDGLSKALASADGITITGGEPFEQPVALEAFLRRIRNVFCGDILVFSGLDRQRLLKHPIVEEGLIDVLISGPYDASAGQTLVLRGSDNQRIDLLTTLARQIYPADIDSMLWESPRRLDFFPDTDGFVMAGIPKPGWGKDMKKGMFARGFSLKTSDQGNNSFHPTPEFGQ